LYRFFSTAKNWIITISALAALAAPARAGIQLVTNGDFDNTTNGGGQLGYNTNATGWTTDGYNFLFTPGSADTTGVDGKDGALELWGPNDGSSNGLPATGPSGGNFVAADGAFEVGAIQQTIDGLTPGEQYTLTFNWAGAQQEGFNGATTEQWQVSLGSETQDTIVVDNPNHGFSGWMSETMYFTADSASEVLSFLAVGTPNGEPPFALLDGVSMEAGTPEPGTLVLFLGGFGAIAALRMRARRR
jgi:hypothetical protein